LTGDDVGAAGAAGAAGAGGAAGAVDGPQARAARGAAVVASKSTKTRPHFDDDGRQRRMVPGYAPGASVSRVWRC